MCMFSFGETFLILFCMLFFFFYYYLFRVSYNLLSTFACNLRRFAFSLATVGTTSDSYLWKKNDNNKKDVKEIMTKQGTTVKYIDLINCFIRKLESRLNFYYWEERTIMFLGFFFLDSWNYFMLLKWKMWPSLFTGRSIYQLKHLTVELLFIFV